MSRSFRRSSLALLLPALGLLFVACSEDDPAAAPAQPSAGKSGAAGNAGGAAGKAGGAGKAGTGGANAGTGGAAGNAGSGGATAGTGGTDAGAAGATAGSGGATAGSGGASAGASGASGSASGAAGSSAGAAGSAGTTAGNGGTSAGSGGTSAGTAGNAGSGGSDAGSGGSDAGSGGTSAGSAGSTAGSAGAGGNASGGSAGTSSGGSAGAAGSGGAAVPACGNAPLQRLNLVATIATDEPKTAVTVVGNTCPTATVQIPYKGQAAYDVERNKPYFLIGTQAGNLTSFTVEGNVKIAALPVVPGGFIMLPPTYPALINPAWNPLTMAIFRVQISSTSKTATAPCNDKGGVVFTVPDHPEAVVKYGGNGTSTGSNGGNANAWITIVTTGTIAAPEYVTVSATKPNCKVGLEQTSTFFTTGRIPVAINVSTAELGLEIANP